MRNIIFLFISRRKIGKKIFYFYFNKISKNKAYYSECVCVFLIKNYFIKIHHVKVFFLKILLATWESIIKGKVRKIFMTWNLGASRSSWGQFFRISHTKSHKRPPANFNQNFRFLVQGGQKLVLKTFPKFQISFDLH